MFYKKVNFNHLSSLVSIFLCFLMSFVYVFGLYIWSYNYRYNRDQVAVMKRRFLSVTLSCVISLLILYFVSNDNYTSTTPLASSNESYYLHIWIGFRFDLTTIYSIALPLLLTMCLFIGPIVQWFLLQDSRFQLGSTLSSIFFWRNYVIAPFSEEFVFRSCMIPIIVHCLGIGYTCFLTPLYFGLAHLHHIIEGIMTNNGTKSVSGIVLTHLFQFVYTYLFGIYSSYLFLRTANFFPCFVVHSFCNLMGFPNLAELKYSFNGLKRWTIIGIYVLGVILFAILLKPLTQPYIFDNQLFK